MHAFFIPKLAETFIALIRKENTFINQLLCTLIRCANKFRVANNKPLLIPGSGSTKAKDKYKVHSRIQSLQSYCIMFYSTSLLVCYYCCTLCFVFFYYMIIYLLTAIGLSLGDSSTVHIYTQTIYRTIQNKQYIEQHNNFGRVRAVPLLG